MPEPQISESTNDLKALMTAKNEDKRSESVRVPKDPPGIKRPNSQSQSL